MAHIIIQGQNNKFGEIRVSGNIKGNNNMTGSVVGSNNVVGNIKGKAVITGNVTGNTSITGDITGDGNITGNIMFTDDFDKAFIQKLTQRQTTFLKKHDQYVKSTPGFPGTDGSLIKLDSVFKSVCMIVIGHGNGRGLGTGFLAKVPGRGIVFMTAGHNFGSCSITLPSRIDFSNLTVHFGNTRGITTSLLSGEGEGMSYNLHDFLGKFSSFRGSIALSGSKIKIKNQDQSVEESKNEMEDYCALLLEDEGVEEKLKKLGLGFLDCGDKEFLDEKPGEMITIFGHPAAMERDPSTEEALYPLRISFGIEKEREEDLEGFILYDNDTLQGNSGSPVVGRGSQGEGFRVKGIHIKGIVMGQTNGAQGLGDIQEWIS